jgi:hypothetical protein
MPITLVLILVVFIVAMIWLINWEPDKDKDAKGKKDDKTLHEEITGVFKKMKDDARTFDRKEFVPSLEEAQQKVLDVLEKKELLFKA